MESIILYDVILKYTVKQIDGHAYAPTNCFLYEGRRIATFAKNEVIMWKQVYQKDTDNKEWKQQFLYPFTCKPVNSVGSEIAGIIYSGRLRIFTRHLIVQFSEEYGDLQDDLEIIMMERKNSMKNPELMDKVVKGPLNLLFPKILRTLQSEDVL